VALSRAEAGMYIVGSRSELHTLIAHSSTAAAAEEWSPCEGESATVSDLNNARGSAKYSSEKDNRRGSSTAKPKDKPGEESGSLPFKDFHVHSFG
jgi:hypothetical protein